jgi:gamma-glutamyltranspeptidase/glutathione hydrolase
MHPFPKLGLLASIALLAVPAAEARTAPARHTAPATRPLGVVSASDERAAAAGAAILRQGGSATDAAIAAMLVLNVVEPQNSGLGGGTFFLRHDARTGALNTIDGRETAPAAATPKWFYGADGKLMPGRELGSGGKSAGVPGSLATMALAHKRYGRLPWAALFQPAIRLADGGFAVSARMHNGLALYGGHVEGWARQAFFTPTGEAVAQGATLRLPDLAATLKTIAAKGPQVFYTGPMAARMAGALNTATHNPSQMTVADFAAYRAKDRTPVCGSYRGWKICGMGPPSSGAISVLMILRQLERFDMAGMGRSSPVAWHLFAESTRLAYADRGRYVADPDFVSVPVKGLLDPAYIATRSALISPTSTLALIEPGQPVGAPERTKVAFRDDPGTTDLAVADGRGEVVQVTTTVNGYFGSGVASDGFMLNNEMPDFDAAPERDGYLVANRVEGGKRPRSSMAPTIVFDPAGKPRLAIGAAGGATIPAQVAKALIGVIDWKLTAQEAIDMGLLYAPTKGGTLEQGTELAAMAPALAALGETVKPGALGLKANAVEFADGHWRGAADPRSEGASVNTRGEVTRVKPRANQLNGAHE